MVIGSRLDENALGKVKELSKDLYLQLSEPGTIVIDESDLGRLGVKGVGDHAEVAGNRVRIVGLTTGLKSLAGPYVFCSINTARPLLRVFPDQITYVLGKCFNPKDAATVVSRLKENQYV
jgi:putative ABC transport system permease protein